MQPWDKTLTDQKIADVLTYERSEWGNNASPVTAEQIAALRKELANHPNSFTEPDYLQFPTKIFPAEHRVAHLQNQAKPQSRANHQSRKDSVQFGSRVRASRVFDFPVAFSKGLAFSIRTAEDVAFRRHHHVVEVLGEHRSGEESDGTQCFLTDINEVVFYRRWNGKNTSRTDLVGVAIFHVQFPGSGDDVLRFFGGIGMPAEPFSWLDLINDSGRRGRAVAAIHGESTSPMN